MIDHVFVWHDEVVLEPAAWEISQPLRPDNLCQDSSPDGGDRHLVLTGVSGQMAETAWDIPVVEDPTMKPGEWRLERLGEWRHGDHACACARCDPELQPQGPRTGEGHLAVRFGDWPVQVYLDGEKIRDCYEVLIGPAGARAWRYRDHSCRTCIAGRACAYIHEGAYSVVRVTVR